LQATTGAAGVDSEEASKEIRKTTSEDAISVGAKKVPAVGRSGRLLDGAGSPGVGISMISMSNIASKNDADGLAHEAAEEILIKELEELQRECNNEMQEEELNPGK